MNVISEIQRINELELSKGLVGTSASWHTKYADSAWVYVGNLPPNLSEGDVLCILSQFGEIEDINLVRDNETGKSRGFAFVKYEDARSCILAVDNFAGTKVLGRSLRVDHCEKYRLPKELLEKHENAQDDETTSETQRQRTDPGHAYQGQEMANEFSITTGQDLFAPPIEPQRSEPHQDQTEASEIETAKEAKKKRKEERARIRKEREEQRLLREEKRRAKRSRDFRDPVEEHERRRSHKKDRKS